MRSDLLGKEGTEFLTPKPCSFIIGLPTDACVCVCFLLRRTPKPASLIAQPAFHYVFKLPVHEEDEASEIYMFRLVAGGTRVYEVVLFPSGTSCSL